MLMHQRLDGALPRARVRFEYSSSTRANELDNRSESILYTPRPHPERAAEFEQPSGLREKSLSHGVPRSSRSRSGSSRGRSG